MKGFLERLGYHVVVTDTEQETLTLLREVKPPISLILVNLGLGSDQALEAGRRIRTLGELSEEVPIVVLPSEYQDEKEGSDEPMGGNDYKSYMTTTGQLESLLKKTLQKNSGELEKNRIGMSNPE